MLTPCALCVYAHPASVGGPKIVGQGKMYECHRFPPSVTVVGITPQGAPQTVTVWPLVSDKQLGCAEFIQTKQN